MKKTILPLLVLAALVAACVPSVNPFYTDKDVITDARLLGKWQEADKTNKPETWQFASDTNNAYLASYTDNEGKRGVFETHLFKLQDTTFMDLTPADCDYATNQSGMVAMMMIPGHYLLRTKLSDDKLTVAPVNYDWVKKFLEKNPAAIAHRFNQDEIILTAETGALQKFILQHLGTNELFGEDGDYIRPPK
jgi:hypothetical protein